MEIKGSFWIYTQAKLHTRSKCHHVILQRRQINVGPKDFRLYATCIANTLAAINGGNVAVGNNGITYYQEKKIINSNCSSKIFLTLFCIHRTIYIMRLSHCFLTVWRLEWNCFTWVTPVEEWRSVCQRRLCFYIFFIFFTFM